MESSAPTASPSLKKLKREAAQRRKAQARSLKLRADEQERLQRLEIDALVEQQRLQRLERQRCEEDAAARVIHARGHNTTTHPSSGNDGGKCKVPKQQSERCMESENNKKVKDAVAGWRGKDSQRTKHVQQQSMRAAVESRRRLARGPRSGVAADSHPTLPSEDHRVVSTDYQAAGTQALMRVTLLAAGFVIGARGISARLIGQVTGAIVQSWTESCRPDAVPIRLFRIQGKKAVVQAAVALIGLAVAKYKDLCDCKRRGEFVQREHIIDGVEFYYQPPPRKAFNIVPESRCSNPSSDAQHTGVVVCSAAAVSPTQLSFTPHHVWLQHLHAQQQQKQEQHVHEQAANSGAVVDNNPMAGRPQTGFFDWRQQQPVVQQQKAERGLDCADPERCNIELERIDQGLQQSVASLEHALQKVRLEQRLLQHNRGVIDSPDRNNNFKQNKQSLWTDVNHDMAPGFQLGSSLFSIFGNGGLPLPVAHDGRSDAGTAVGLLNSTASTTPFDFPRCDFLRESLPSFPFSPRDSGPLPEYSLYGHNKIDSEDSLCIVCLEQPAGVRLMACGHTSFCLACVQGLVNCPLCREKIVGLHQYTGSRSMSGSAQAGPAAQRGTAVAAKLNGSSYHLWNWIPGASV